MSLRAVETVVRDRLGLDPEALGPRAVERAADARMRARGVVEPGLYAAALAADPAERDAFADELVVPETWFFRGGRALFDRLAGFLADRAAARHGGPVRALSVPCSTGEEPYSLAIALHERLLGPAEVTVDAVDLSGPVLARAAAARYTSFAFREAGPDVRPAYFRAADDRWELSPSLRAAVRFVRANLTDPLFLAGEPPYDLVICRNLFIYLTPEAKQRAMANLDRLLALDGRLCVTPAEADRLPPGRFVPDGPAESGLYRRVGVGSTALKVPAVLLPPPTGGAPAPADTPAPAARPPVGATLGGARALADAGQLTDARAMCEKLLRLTPTDADALALLGVIHVAAGRTAEAFEALRKALYLAPDHAEALAHMVVLCERRGDAARAAALRKRLGRLARADGGAP